jgi:hypothetical protein
MNSKVKCNFCNSLVDIKGKSHDLPLWNSVTGEPDTKNIDQVMLVLCQKCEGVLGVYKNDKHSN